MRVLLKVVAVAGLASSLVGCSVAENLYARQDVVKNRDKDYLKAKNSKPLEMPPGVELVGAVSSYPIPGVKATKVGFSDDALYPPGSSIAQLARETRAAKLLQPTDKVELSSDMEEASSGRYFLAIDQSGSGSWNAIGLALLTANYSIVRQDRVYGIYYVVHNTAEGSADEIPLYGIKLSNKGLLDMGGVAVNIVNEQGESIHEALEQEMLNTLSEHVNKLSKAEAADAEKRVTLLTRNINGNPLLLLNRGKDNAWQAVERALSNTDYLIVRRNQEGSVLYAADPSVTGGKATADSALYAVYVRTQGGISRVLVLNEDLTIPTHEVANTLLASVERNLLRG